MADNLSLVSTKNLGPTLQPPEPVTPPDSLVGSNINDSITRDVNSLAKNKLAEGTVDLLHEYLVERLKDFLKDEQDTSETQSEIKEKLKNASENLSDATDLNSSKDAIDLENVNEEASTSKISIEDSFVANIVGNVLKILKLDDIASICINQTVSNIKSLIDSNAPEFKKNLTEQFDKELEIIKFNKIKSESAEDTYGNKVKKETAEDESKTTLPNVELDTNSDKKDEQQNDELETIEENKEEKQQEESKEEVENKQPPVDTTKEKNENDPSKINKEQNQLDKKRKEDLLKIDKNLDETNQLLKKIIDKNENVVESYNAREKESENVDENNKKEKKQTSMVEENGEEEDSEEPKEKNKFGNIFSKGLKLGSFVLLWFLFRSWASGSGLKNYIAKHPPQKTSDSSSIDNDISGEVKNINDESSNLDSSFNTADDKNKELLKNIDKAKKENEQDQQDVEKELSNVKQQRKEENESSFSDVENIEKVEIPTDSSEEINVDKDEINALIDKKASEHKQVIEKYSDSLNNIQNNLDQTAEANEQSNQSLNNLIEGVSDITEKEKETLDDIQEKDKKVDEIHTKNFAERAKKAQNKIEDAQALSDENNKDLEEAKSGVDEIVEKTKEFNEVVKAQEQANAELQKQEGERTKVEEKLKNQIKERDEVSKDVSKNIKERNKADAYLDSKLEERKKADEELSSNINNLESAKDKLAEISTKADQNNKESIKEKKELETAISNSNKSVKERNENEKHLVNRIQELEAEKIERERNQSESKSSDEQTKNDQDQTDKEKFDSVVSEKISELNKTTNLLNMQMLALFKTIDKTTNEIDKNLNNAQTENNESKQTSIDIENMAADTLNTSAIIQVSHNSNSDEKKVDKTIDEMNNETRTTEVLDDPIVQMKQSSLSNLYNQIHALKAQVVSMLMRQSILRENDSLKNKVSILSTNK